MFASESVLHAGQTHVEEVRESGVVDAEKVAFVHVHVTWNSRESEEEGSANENRTDREVSGRNYGNNMQPHFPHIGNLSTQVFREDSFILT